MLHVGTSYKYFHIVYFWWIKLRHRLETFVRHAPDTISIIVIGCYQNIVWVVNWLYLPLQRSDSGLPKDTFITRFAISFEIKHWCLSSTTSSSRLLSKDEASLTFERLAEFSSPLKLLTSHFWGHLNYHCPTSRGIGLAFWSHFGHTIFHTLTIKTTTVSTMFVILRINSETSFS